MLLPFLSVDTEFTFGARRGSRQRQCKYVHAFIIARHSLFFHYLHLAFKFQIFSFGTLNFLTWFYYASHDDQLACMCVGDATYILGCYILTSANLKLAHHC